MGSFPLRVGSAEAFAAARRFLAASGFTEPFLLKRFEAPNVFQILFPDSGIERSRYHLLYQGGGPALLLARLFLGGFVEAERDVEAQIPSAALAAFRELGLLAPYPSYPPSLFAPALLCPSFGFYIASDRAYLADESPGYQGEDFVLSGVDPICRVLISILPEAPCRTFLEMGTGCGLAALMGADYAGKASGIDIVPRCIDYAEFNARLNGRDVEFLTGDLFAPVAGRRFDRIGLNPPFHPRLVQEQVFAAGGDDGEALLHRAVAESPRHLESGGRLYSLAVGTDRKGGSFESRLVESLGASAEECDLALFVHSKVSPHDYAMNQILTKGGNPAEAEAWMALYQRLEATQVLMCHLVLQRHGSQRPPFRIRRDFGPGSGVLQVEWLMAIETRRREPGFDELLLGSRPRAANEWEIRTHTSCRGHQAGPVHTSLHVSQPFRVKLDCDPALASLVTACDGKRTGAEILDWASQELETPRERLLPAFGELVSCGFVILPQIEPPGEKDPS